MKKVVPIMLALGLGASLISGCGRTQQAGENTGAAAQSDISAAEAAESVTAASNAQAVPADAYVIYVQDAESGEPVKGAMIQLCTDTECRAANSDEEGKAVFETEPADYTAHLIKAPDGYEASSEELTLTADNRTATYKIRKTGEGSANEGSSTEEVIKYYKTDASWDCPNTGLELKVPENFKDYKGQIHPADRGQTDIDSGIVYCSIMYLGRTDAERKAIEETTEAFQAAEEYTEEEEQQYKAAVDEYYAAGNMPFLFVFGCKDGITLDDAMKDTFDEEVPISKTQEIGKAGSFTYYYVIPDVTDYMDLFREACPEEMQPEYEALLADAEKIAEGITIKEPKIKDNPLKEGTSLSFETKDLDGNTVKSEDLFGGHKITMINRWATWCDPCKNELEELEALSKELEGKDCQIIGICDDTLGDDAAIEEAKKILEEHGVTYLNLVQTEELREQFKGMPFPTSCFVDSTGKIMVPPVAGANVEKCGERIEEALGKLG